MVPEHKLFIGMIPKSSDESDIRQIFKPYGEIEEVYILRQQGGGQSKGIVVVGGLLDDGAKESLLASASSSVFGSFSSAIRRAIRIYSGNGFGVSDRIVRITGLVTRLTGLTRRVSRDICFLLCHVTSQL